MRGWTDIGTPRRCFHDDGNYRPGVGVGSPHLFLPTLPLPLSLSLLPFSPFEPSLPANAPRYVPFFSFFQPQLLYDFSYRRLPLLRGMVYAGGGREERGEKEVTGEQRMWNLSFLQEFLNNLLFLFLLQILLIV